MSAQSLLQMLRMRPRSIVPMVCPLLQLRFMSSPKPKTVSRPKDKFDKQKQLREMKRNKKTEYKHMLQEESKKVHCMKIMLKGEPLDPEALNPERKRPPTEETEEDLDTEAEMLKKWSVYKKEETARMYRELTALKDSRIRAMRELKKACPSLYYEALREQLELPIEIKAIPEFPPVEGYEAPEPYDQLFPARKY